MHSQLESSMPVPPNRLNMTRLDPIPNKAVPVCSLDSDQVMAASPTLPALQLFPAHIRDVTSALIGMHTYPNHKHGPV